MVVAEENKAVVNVPTVVAIGALVMSLNVAVHEAVHALACPLVGGELQVYTALSVECAGVSGVAGKIVSGSAPFFNLLIGAALYFYLRGQPSLSDTPWFATWLLMLANFLSGAGYFIFSGVAGVGDMAVVIAGWQPTLLWRGLLFLVGALMFIGLIALSLRVFGLRVGGTADEQIGRASRLAFWAYIGFLLPVVLAALFNPDGLGGLPAVAGLAAVLFGQSPLLWMMQWFRAETFTKLPGDPLQIRPSWVLIAVAFLVVALYGIVLGRGIYFQ
jgi:hypothetical protein